MLTISKPLSAGQAQTYHKEEFANAEENYYSEGDRIRGEWNGKLAEEWGLRGDVQEEHFQRLASGLCIFFFPLLDHVDLRVRRLIRWAMHIIVPDNHIRCLASQ